jgi:hypothetical protein
VSSDANTNPLFLNRVLVVSADHHLFFGRNSATPSDGRSQPLSGPVHPQVRRLLLDGEQVGIREREAIDAWEKVKLEITTEAQRRRYANPRVLPKRGLGGYRSTPFCGDGRAHHKSNPNAIYVKPRDLYCINQACGPYIQSLAAIASPCARV